MRLIQYIYKIRESFGSENHDFGIGRILHLPQLREQHPYQNIY